PDSLPSVPRGVAFGMVDRPELQRHEVAVYDPGTDGDLLIVGAAGSGRTTVLAALAAGAGGGRIRRGVVEVWDAVAEAADHGNGDGLLLIDDLDAVLDRLDDEQRFRLVRRLLIIAGNAGSTGGRAD